MSTENHLSLPLTPWRIDWLRSVGAINSELERRLHSALAAPRPTRYLLTAKGMQVFPSGDSEVRLSPEIAARHCAWYQDEAVTQAEHEVNVCKTIAECTNTEAAAFLRALQRMVRPKAAPPEKAPPDATINEDRTLAELAQHLLDQWAFSDQDIWYTGPGDGDADGLRDALEAALKREAQAEQGQAPGGAYLEALKNCSTPEADTIDDPWSDPEDKQPGKPEGMSDSRWAQSVIDRLTEPLVAEIDFSATDDRLDAERYFTSPIPTTGSTARPPVSDIQSARDRGARIHQAMERLLERHFSQPRARETPKPEAPRPAWPESNTKARWDLVPFKAVDQIAQVLTFGAKKYKDNNWREGTRWGRCYAALQRHVTAWWEGEEVDPETGASHLAHAGCCLFFLMEFQRNGWGDDDRFKGQTGAEMLKFDGAAPTPSDPA
jgi:Domain of unknown function (DUF5664)